ncbi:hypothetical protein DWY54_13895, partial [Parabacteroides distasonis]
KSKKLFIKHPNTVNNIYITKEKKSNGIYFVIFSVFTEMVINEINCVIPILIPIHRFFSFNINGMQLAAV